MYFRSDGLLRGSREERVQAMSSLCEAEWNLNTILELHCGLVDHAEDVRAAAMEALQAITNRKPKPASLTPVDLLSYFLFEFTVSSGVRVATFSTLVELGTPEADQAIERLLLGTQRNEDFSDFIKLVQRAGKSELLRGLQAAKLSKTKAAMLRSALSDA
jgi:hypothetical protein